MLDLKAQNHLKIGTLKNALKHQIKLIKMNQELSEKHFIYKKIEGIFKLGSIYNNMGFFGKSLKIYRQIFNN